jgi:hypothetical protein
MRAVKSCFLYKTIGDCDGAPEGGTVRVGLELTSAAESVSGQSVQISRYLLASCRGQIRVATRAIERVTCLLLDIFWEKHSPP